MKLMSIVICMLFCFQASGASRQWEHWDESDIAETIEHYWNHSREEISHRKNLMRLTQMWLQPGDSLLEVGCGSGLIYQQLVPKLINNDHYTGIDISHKMLGIAEKKYPRGTFLKDDLYALSFADHAFDIVIAYEVLGHLGELSKPIKEMFRVSARAVIFTIWEAETTTITTETIQGKTFIHNAFSEKDMTDLIHASLDGTYTVKSTLLPGQKRAYMILK